MPREIPLATPGEILQEDFLTPLDITPNALAEALDIPAERIEEIIHGRRAIDADSALRLAKFFGTDAQSWLNLQAHYDTEQARETLNDALERIQPYQPRHEVH
jgi:addiction module HigA family antidote